MSDLRTEIAELESVFCEHANECPCVCPCPRNCYCKARTCKDRAFIEPLVAMPVPTNGTWARRINRFRERLKGRLENNKKTCFQHPDKDASHDAQVRYQAYLTALKDLDDILEDK